MEIIIDMPTPELKEAVEKKIKEHFEREYNDRITDKTDKKTS